MKTDQEIDFLRNELGQLWQFVHDSGLDASKLVFSRSPLIEKYQQAVEALKQIGASGSDDHIKNIFRAQDTLRDLGEL